MNSPTADAPAVTLSITIYRSLLIVHPRQFRSEYAPHMLQVFRDCCLRAFQDKGSGAVVRFWMMTLFDLMRSALQQHLQKEAYMSRSQFIRLGGAALMISSLAYVIDNISLGVWLIGSVLLAIGILGLRARYGKSAGAFGSRVLLAGVIGMFSIYVIFAVIYLGAALLGGLRLEGTTVDPVSLWVLLYAGPALPLLALALFGISALRNKPMARLNWLPLATGIWFPALYGFITPYLLSHHGAFPDQYWNAIFPLLLLQFFTLCLLGAMLIYDRVQELVPA